MGRTLAAALTIAAFLALAWMLFTPAHSKPAPGRSLAGLMRDCQRIGAENSIRNRGGQIEALTRDKDGCLVWRRMHSGGPR
ncbi:hypothetical protein SAMN06297251_102157 [Fulvimarina manganoxydans]|uniref:Uncharacterized protein n=1 Tax=Fulvimarina manganoxydans TaxID=937218 RepID=A0A1W1Z4H7_9HYPH|nr:hypothetical protein [Fulvimarina manganoxydans]SMC43339.1 hypothetical protein SAMN06297251_102157 [Fulvimarina manganoxydans]